MAKLNEWHKAAGFSEVGYHFVIDTDGTILRGRALDKIGAHCIGQNAHSVGIAYIGGLDAAGKPADTRTMPQIQSMQKLVSALRLIFGDVEVHGHNEFAAKACPCFDVRAEAWPFSLSASL